MRVALLVLFITGLVGCNGKPREASPETTESVVTDPVISELVVPEPVVSEPVVSEPVVSEPVVSEPEVSEPEVSEPEVSEPETELEKMLRLAEHGDAQAQFDLGSRYGAGLDVPRDDAESAKWFRQAADQGLAKAQHFLGIRGEDARITPFLPGGILGRAEQRRFELIYN